MAPVTKTPAVTVIAEAGVNHNGSLEQACALVRAAAEAGADVIKFQAFSADGLTAAKTRTAAYQQANTGEEDQRALLRGLELSLDDFAVLAGECAALNIEFLSTPFDPDLAEPLIALGMRRLKVASGELTNVVALRRFGEFGLPVILSTGMASEAEVAAALDTLRDAGAGEITVLHCTSLYPAPIETINLHAMATMAARFGVPVGYSDHSLDDHVSVAAVALGATMIEKHFTLDRTLPGPDHRASLEPEAFAVMVRRLRETAAALGDGIKRPAPGEAAVAALVRRSWHAARALPEGTVLGENDLVLLRPADGLPPDRPPIGRRLREAVDPEQSITGDMVA